MCEAVHSRPKSAWPVASWKRFQCLEGQRLGFHRSRGRKLQSQMMIEVDCNLVTASTPASGELFAVGRCRLLLRSPANRITLCRWQCERRSDRRKAARRLGVKRTAHDEKNRLSAEDCSFTRATVFMSVPGQTRSKTSAV